MVARSLLCLLVATAAARAEPVDYIADAKLLYRIAACGGTERVEDKLVKIVERHCKQIDEKLAAFRAQYFDKGRAWFDAVVPKTAPKTVVYPFGGGDLISALVAFPGAVEITTISLEGAGDPRRLRTLSAKEVELNLGALRADIGGLIAVGSNTTKNLSAGQDNDLPAQISSFLIGLVAGGYEPVAMRFFTLDDAGNVHYLDQAEIDAFDSKLPKKKRVPPPADGEAPKPKPTRSFSKAFANVELQYRKLGETAVRVHRHLSWDLSDGHLRKHPQLIRHLEKKGDVTFLVKGASYLLWYGEFSRVREYILDHLAWMLSDSTGVPPAYAKPAGMVQETYGAYRGAFLPGPQASKHDEDFIELWTSQKRRKLPFRFGYVDAERQAHVVVTKPRER